MLAMDNSMARIDDDDELDRILETTNLDEFKLIESPLEQLDDESQENLGVGPAPTIHVASTLGLPPRNGSMVELCSVVDPWQGSSPSFSPLIGMPHTCVNHAHASI